MRRNLSLLLGTFLVLAVAVFALNASAFGITETILYTFTGGSDGGGPFGNLVFDSTGQNLYGTTSAGGVSNSKGGNGVVFQLSHVGGTWVENVIYAFAGGGDGAAPLGGVIFDSAGNLYGTTNSGGANGLGTVFELSPASGGGWTEQVIYSFAGGSDGANPNGGLAIDSTGNLFGTTSTGGAANLGTVFEVSPVSGGGWSERVILTGTKARGGGFLRTVVFDAAHNLYATAPTGGASNAGSIYRLRANSTGGWRPAAIYSFLGGSDGSSPIATLTTVVAGHLYGTTQAGGNFSSGTAFELILNSAGTWVKTILYNFGSKSTDALFPTEALITEGSRLFGTSSSGGRFGSGTIFELSRPIGVWQEQVLHSFTTGSDTGGPAGSLLLSASNLVGLGHNGGSFGAGGVYELSPN